MSPWNPITRMAAVFTSVMLFSGCSTTKKSDGEKKPDGAGIPVQEGGGTTSGGIVPLIEGESPAETRFRQACAEQAASAKGVVASGKNGWGFNAEELEVMARAERTAEPAVVAISAYHKDLKNRGIQLVVLPVPPKAMLYPDELSPDWKLKARKVRRFDSYLQETYRSLRARGVTVVDTMPEMLDRRKAKTGTLYPKTDSSWSPRACELAAKPVAEVLRAGKWLEDSLRVTGLDAVEQTVSLEGDLNPGGVRETLPARVITGVVKRDGAPLLVLADRNGMVFDDTGASFAHQLAYELRLPFEQIASSASGRNIPRTRALRKTMQSPAYLDGRKAVVWLIAAQEFYETDWRQVPASMEIRNIEEGLRDTQ